LKKKLRLILLIMLITAFAVGCGGKDERPATGPQQLIESRCVRCHNLDRVYVARDSDEWPEIVELMVRKSPRLLTESEIDEVVKYLQENYGQ
jgi:nitrate/TMAO reductase-like tetraheme cytochrome c subunit